MAASSLLVTGLHPASSSCAKTWLLKEWSDDRAVGGTEEAVKRMIGKLTKEEDGSLRYSGTLSHIFI